jgi:hypothetical protein
MEKPSKKTKIKGTDIALIVVAVFDIFFTLVMAQLFYLYQSVPDSLIVAVFGVTFGECGFCTLVYKIKKGVKTDGIHGAELPTEDQTDGDQGHAGVEDLGVLDSGSGIY